MTLLIALTAPQNLPRLDYAVSWVGNSYSGKEAWVQHDVEDIEVQPDGTVLTNVFWEEAGGNVQQYREGRPERVAGHTHGWGYGGGKAVSANSKYVFIAQRVDSEGGGLKGDSWPKKGLEWSGVSRRLRSDMRQGSPFEGGRGKEGDVVPGSFLPVAEIPQGREGEVTGLLATERALYASCTFDGAIHVFDPDTMRRLARWPLARPWKIAREASGSLWVLQGPARKGEPWQALRLSPDGRLLPRAIVFPLGVVPNDLCVDGKNRLLVADGGKDNQIKIYGDLARKPRLMATFGAKGGLFAPPAGRVGERRFNRPVGVGTDAKGTVVVASDGSTAGGGAVLEAYGADGKRRYVRYGLQFVDLPDAAPDDLADVYTKEERYRLDPSGGWSYRGYTANPDKYPDDPRLWLDGTNAQVRVLGGRRFLFVSDMTAEYLHAYRFDPKTDGETAIPCALFARRHREGAYPPHQPLQDGWAWLDADADGRIEAYEYAPGGGAYAPDERGDLWRLAGGAALRLPFAGVSPSGLPRWNLRSEESYPLPKDLDEVRRMRYLPDSDTMLLAGERGGARHQHWKPMGPVIARYEGWRSGKQRRGAITTLPFKAGSSGHESVEPISFDVAGDYAFVAYTRGLSSEGLRNAFVKVLRLSDLSVVGNLSAETQLGETGLLDLVESVRARRAPDGGYLIFMEDDYRAKTVVFRWRPPKAPVGTPAR